MKRRDFSLACGAVVAGAVLVPSAALAQAKPPVAGIDYLVVEKSAAVEAPAGKIEVVGFFRYDCPHCNAFEPVLEEWIKRIPKDIHVRRVPVGFGDDQGVLQRLYYALEAMNLVNKLHGKVFRAIHVERESLRNPVEIADWVAKQGVDKVKFVEQYSSFSVATKATRAAQLQDAYKIDGVPALGVAGRYWTDGVMAKGMPHALQVVDFLLANIRAGK
jgi:thiol:disulfide interchange protein DsbA